MDDRQKELVLTIVREYVKNAKPVGSAFLANRFKKSSATLRNEMAELEELGFLNQPHTSAGRIPTSSAYRLFVEQLQLGQRMAQKMSRLVQKHLQTEREKQSRLQRIAKALASATRGMAVVDINNETFCTGYTHLFSQPEFHAFDQSYPILKFIENFPEYIRTYRRKRFGDFGVFIGEDNFYPEVSECSLVLMRVNNSRHRGVIGLLGPKRMDYEKAIHMISELSEVLEEA